MATKKKAAAVAVDSYPGEDKWRAEDDMRTLARAAEIHKDPKRLAAAKKMAREKLAELRSVVNEGKKAP